MAPVVALLFRVVVVPLTVVDWNLHLGGIAVIHAITASVVFATVEVLRVVDVRVVLEAIEIASTLIVSPCLPVGLRLLCRGC